MAGDRQLNNIIPQTVSPASRKMKIVFWVSLSALLLTIGGTIFFNKQNEDLKAQKLNIEKKIEQNTNRSLKRELLSAGEKVSTLKQLLNRHHNPVKIFALVGSLCHPQVQIVSMNLNNLTRKVDISAVARDYTALGQQILVLIKDERVENLAVSNVSLNIKGNLDFSFSFNFPALH